MALNSATVSVGDVATATQYNNVRKDIVQFGGDYATTGGTQPTYTLTVESQFVLVAGAIVKGIIHSANAGGAATLNVNGGGAVAIKKFGGGALVAGDLPANAQVIWIYSGSVWNILAISSPFAFLSAKGSLPVASAAGNLIDLVIGIINSSTEDKRLKVFDSALSSIWFNNGNPAMGGGFIQLSLDNIDQYITHPVDMMLLVKESLMLNYKSVFDRFFNKPQSTK